MKSTSKRERHRSSSSDLGDSKSSSSSSSEDERRKKKKRKLKAKKIAKRDKGPEKEKVKERKAATVLEEPTEKIGPEDFYRKNEEFRLWLRSKKRLYFDELLTSDAKKHFKKFVKKWNKGKLDKKCYEGMSTTAMSSASKTRYEWKFAQSVDMLELADVRDSVGVWTQKAGQLNQRGGGRGGGRGRGGGHSSWVQDRNASHVAGSQPGSSQWQERRPMGGDRQERQERDTYSGRKADKQYRQDKKVVEEELAPRETGGHAARQEKRLLRQASNLARQQSPDTADSVIMGDDAIGRRLAAEKARNDARRQVRSNRASEKLHSHQEKEREKMQALLEMARASKSQDALWKT
ncbi:PREDICTED: zinc finger CCCH domain-containing protein 4-like [Priapulus caudatus]|uniref:Zinc finger CCCH domain-containing protein 4-like n=1 Tax=Priapulus caudatus TaxID=37621 RepID=A0ABM1EQR0_PRICU|nr:PREDICTED: zinc finger CCCH domain-containing protein 4-like [Priapulus caudatus]